MPSPSALKTARGPSRNVSGRCKWLLLFEFSPWYHCQWLCFKVPASSFKGSVLTVVSVTLLMVYSLTDRCSSNRSGQSRTHTVNAWRDIQHKDEERIWHNVLILDTLLFPHPVTVNAVLLWCSPFKAWSRSNYSHACFVHCQNYFFPCLNVYLPEPLLSFFFLFISSPYFLTVFWLTQ